MRERPADRPVIFAASLESIYQAASVWERRFRSRCILRAWNGLQVGIVNLLLNIAALVFFKNRGRFTRDFERIVIHTSGMLGDNLVMLPAIHAVRHRYPAAHLTVICNCQGSSSAVAEGLFRDCPSIDRLVIVDDDYVVRERFKFRLDRNQVADVSCDLFVNLSPFGNRGRLGHVIREQLLAWYLGASVAVGFRVATISRRGRFAPVQHHFVRNEPRRAWDVLRHLGITSAAPSPAVAPISVARRSMQSKLRALGYNGESIAVIHPGAQLEIQRWPVAHFGELVRELRTRYGFFPVVTGGSREADLARSVVEASGGSGVSVAGLTDLAELIELVRDASVCVTNDTGIGHVSAALDRPTVVLLTTRFMPTHWYPNGSKVVALFKLLECSACYLDWASDCGHVSCLTSISVDDVLNAMDQLCPAIRRKDTHGERRPRMALRVLHA